MNFRNNVNLTLEKKSLALALARHLKKKSNSKKVPNIDMIKKKFIYIYIFN